MPKPENEWHSYIRSATTKRLLFVQSQGRNMQISFYNIVVDNDNENMTKNSHKSNFGNEFCFCDGLKRPTEWNC